MWYIDAKTRINLQLASMIFLDAPVGTGFSYSRTAEGYNMNDTLSASQIYAFLRKVSIYTLNNLK